MEREQIMKLADMANEVSALNNDETRYWVFDDGRYAICHNAMTEMDDIDEVSEKEFVSRIKRFLK